METFDIIIIGAGPAGLNAAKILGDAGKKVLLLEKNEKIGPKICAGGLTRKSKEFLNLPDSLIEKSFSGIVFKAPHLKTKIQLEKDYFFLINREKIGQWQLGKINTRNVTVRTQAHVTNISANYLTLNGGKKIGFNYLIGADGSASIVRRHLKLQTKLWGIAIQYLIPQKNYNDLEVNFDSPSFGPWYAWIFPRQDYVSVGYGYPAKSLSPKKINPVKTQQDFEDWARKNSIDLTGATSQSFPINCDFRGYVFGNIYLVGDAAGLASGFTGEGIYQALISGEEVANIILDKNYQPHLIKEALRERSWHHFFLYIIYYSGPLRNFVFDFVALAVKIKFLGRTLIRILS
jgi:geranylgeranyl reductase family protein